MINYETFLRWAKDNFDNVSTSGSEVKVNSVFIEDFHQHLWCNPSKNAFHCWKTDKSGNLYELVCLVNKCSYKEAAKILGIESELRLLEERVDKLFQKKETFHGETSLKPSPISKEIELPLYTVPIQSLDANHQLRIYAEAYLKDRCLSPEELFICTGGEYRNRIVIPYYSPTGSLIYWNARDLTGKAKAKYRGPDDDKFGVAKKEVLWMSKWAKSGTKIYLTEGEFDAMSLAECGFIAGAVGGKNLHATQIELLHVKQYQLVKSYRICLSFDADKSGKEALNKIGWNLLRNGITVSYVRPPVGFKDWNEMFVKKGKEIVQLWIATEEKLFTQDTPNLLRGEA
jgi:DNA primase